MPPGRRLVDGNKNSFHKILGELAAGGYAAATVQYRPAPAHRFPAPPEDVREAVRFLRDNAARWNIDRSRIALMGGSAGGHLALLLGFADAGTPGAVQALIDLSGPTDLRSWRMESEAELALRKTTGRTAERLREDYLGAADRSAPIFAQTSPVANLRPGAPPVLIFQWRDDRAVPSSQAEMLARALEENGVRHELVWFEGKGHALNGPGAGEIVPRTLRFLKPLFAAAP